MVQAASQLSPELLLKEDLIQLNRGHLTEQFVGQHLLAVQPEYERASLYYWQRDAKNSQAEIDYLFNFEDMIIPIEVKSGKTGRLKSLHSYLSEQQAKLGIKLSIDEFDTQQTIWSIPLYLIEQLPRLLAQYRCHT